MVFGIMYGKAKVEAAAFIFTSNLRQGVNQALLVCKPNESIRCVALLSFVSCLFSLWLIVEMCSMPLLLTLFTAKRKSKFSIWFLSTS